MAEKIYQAMDIARYVLNKCTNENHPISNLQLQKILYFLQREYLAEQGRPLFADDIQAWQFGPVVPEVYYQYCGFGSRTIGMDYDVTLDPQDKVLIDEVVEEKRSKKPWELVEEIQAQDKAWAHIYRDGMGNRCVIPKGLIRIKG